MTICKTVKHNRWTILRENCYKKAYLKSFKCKTCFVIKSYLQLIDAALLNAIIIVIIIIELTHSKTIPENTVEIELQPVASDLKNLS